MSQVLYEMLLILINQCVPEGSLYMNWNVLIYGLMALSVT
jgi:hypothetical protein